MKIKQCTINEIGLSEIHAFLTECHKLGGDHFSRSMLLAWADDAEKNLMDGNAPSIEIRSFDSVSGHAELFTVSDSGLTCEWIEV